MAETLGEALLVLSTDDTRLAQGLLDARRKAERTMNDLAAAQARATTENAQAKAAYKAGEITLEAYNRKLIENRVALAAVQAQHAAAQKSVTSFQNEMSGVTQMAGQQRAGMQQLSFQLNDVATMYALGARPMQIFASQSGQVIQAVQMMTGGTSRLAAFLGGPWGLAVTSAVIVLTPFIGKLFEADDALKSVELASDKLGDAQSILGRVMDSTTLKMKVQTGQAIALARAQAAVGLANAMTRQADARAEQDSISRGGFGDLRVVGTMGGLRLERANNGKDLVDLYRSGRITSDEVEAQARARMNAGVISPEAYKRLLSIPNEVAEGENIRAFQDTLAALDGDTDAARRVFGEQSGRSGSRRQNGPRGRTDAERQEDFADRSFDIERQTLQSRLSLANSAQDRADLQRDLLALERDQRIAEIETLDLNRAQKDALIAQVQALLGTAPKFDEQGNLIVSANRGLEGEIIARELAVRQLQQSKALADIRFEGETEALRNILALADTEAERKEVALRLLEAEEEFERIRLQTIIDAAARGEAEAEAAELAQAQLANLEANAARRRAAVARQNETEVERYLRVNINRTQGQINEAIDGIRIDGLEALNDGLARAIMGAESLGDVFSRVADQIIADLLRIAIQQAIIKPLANSLFGGGGGGGFLGSLFGGGAGSSVGGGASAIGNLFSAFAGGRAKGGMIPTGKFAVVGEEGPELAFAGSGGIGIMSNPDSRRLLSGAAGGMSINMPIKIDATGADAAAIARLNSKIDELKDELPGTIVTTVRDARDRRFL